MGISRRGGDLIMGLISIVVHLVFRSTKCDEAQHADILTQIPSTITAALSKLNLDGRTTIYAVCPACHCTYKPYFKHSSSTAIYPERCTNKPEPDSNECGEQLSQVACDGTQTMKPVKTFVYHHFHDYLAGLLARPDLKRAMDKSCDNLMESLGHPAPTFVTDVFEAEFLRKFEGPKRETLFIDRKGAGRYAFSLNVDFFAVEGMRVRGATMSAGIISLACLNLPPEIRFQPENMYLSIIRGPKEPHLTELNHYMKPLVDDMVHSWENGIRFSRTALHQAGRVTNSAIVAAVMDLPAARKSSGLPGPTSHFYCTVCQCYHQSTLSRTDFENWTKKDHRELRAHAEAWKNASTSAERNKIFVKYGTRWSELWRLPYWDPSRQLVVDAMHCILEGLAYTHFRENLGMTTVAASTSPPLVKAFIHDFHSAAGQTDMTPKEVKQVAEIHDLLTAPADQDENDEWELLKVKLFRKNLKPLLFVCNDLRIHPDKFPRRCFKADWVKALLTWVSDCTMCVPFLSLINNDGTEKRQT